MGALDLVCWALRSGLAVLGQGDKLSEDGDWSALGFAVFGCGARDVRNGWRAEKPCERLARCGASDWTWENALS